MIMMGLEFREQVPFEQVYIHSVGDTTRIDYTPAKGYAGPDKFTVRLLPGNAVVRATVTVEKGAVAAKSG